MNNQTQQRLIRYQEGRIPFFACQADPRFSYCLYVPTAYRSGAAQRLSLVVIIHGSKRSSERYRDAFIEFAEAHHCLILVPLFPMGILGQKDIDSYKMATIESLRYDLLLLAMIDEVKAKYPVAGNKFLMHGFSGGGQFAHRFFYLHPDKLQALSIGAPGQVTLLNNHQPWEWGTGNFSELFGQPIAVELLRLVQVQMVIGAEDTEVIISDSALALEEAAAVGNNRLQRLKSLKKNFANQGIPVRFDCIAGAGHDGFAMLDSVQAFLSNILTDAADMSD